MSARTDAKDAAQSLHTAEVGVTLERADSVATEIVFVHQLDKDDFVLLPEDAGPDRPLLIDEDHERPKLWQYADYFAHGVDGLWLYLYGPDGAELEVMVYEDDEVRRVLPGQDHQRW